MHVCTSLSSSKPGAIPPDLGVITSAIPMGSRRDFGVIAAGS